MEINYPRGGKFPPFNISPWAVPLGLMMLALLAMSSLFYQVDQDEGGVVQRFGQYVRTTPPGLHMKLPFGIETVERVKVTHVFKEEFGFRTVAAGVRTVYAGRETDSRFSGSGNPFLVESLMLTGDLNVAVVEWIVQYTIKDPVAFAFNIRDPRETIRNMSESMMRLVVGDRRINEVLTRGREEIQAEVQDRLQKVLDSYNAGVDVRNVILQDVTPPDEVKPSFNEVNEARQEKEKLINQAWEEYNRVVPRAKGEAEQMVREAEGYALERVNKSQGDAERYLLTLEAYAKAPEVTRQRLYLEMMEKVFPQFQDKVILDESSQGILPLLKLNPEEKGGIEP